MGMGVVLVAMLLAGPAGPPAHPETPLSWGALVGSGLFTLQDTSTLPRGRFVAGVTIDNRDRDPLGLDLVDGAIAWNYGMTAGSEAYGRFIFNRSVAVPDTPVLPPPPLDQIVLPGMSPPRRPYYSVYPPTPYVDDTGAIHFGAGTPGDGLVGAKVRALPPSGWRPAAAALLELQFPMARNLKDLQHGAGTGGFDVRVGGIAEWPRGRWSFVASTAFTRVGTPPYPDRRIEWRDGGVAVTDEPLILPHRLDAGVGARRVLRPNLAAVGEITTVFDVGHRTKIVGRARSTIFVRWPTSKTVVISPTAARFGRSTRRAPTPASSRCGRIRGSSVTAIAPSRHSIRRSGYGGVPTRVKAVDATKLHRPRGHSAIPPTRTSNPPVPAPCWRSFRLRAIGNCSSSRAAAAGRHPLGGRARTLAPTRPSPGVPAPKWIAPVSSTYGVGG